MRDFLPSDVRKRNYVIGIIRDVYEKYGFEPLETPSVENLSTLTGKYGEEGNQLMFKILKRGEKLEQQLIAGEIKSENELSDLALRYDLTVPLARVVANYRNELPKFFKRYQIQPVWRADRPAKGRFREFYQCDVDAIGSKSVYVEAELCLAVIEILQKLGFEDFVIRLNHREILRDLLASADIAEHQQTNALIAIDKLDKIGAEGVLKEFEQRGIAQDSGSRILSFLKEIQSLSENEEILPALEKFIGQDASGTNELKRIVEICNSLFIKIDPSLARGLTYYTGAIFEIALTKGDFAGSVGGGGRYDGLIGMFGKEQIPAVGFSIGLERILYVMEERAMFPSDLPANPADVLVTIWNDKTAGESLKLAGDLRAENLRVLVYPEADKLGKQFKYADSLSIPWVCILGESELAENKVALKNMKTGDQETVDRRTIREKIKS